METSGLAIYCRSYDEDDDDVISRFETASVRHYRLTAPAQLMVAWADYQSAYPI